LNGKINSLNSQLAESSKQLQEQQIFYEQSYETLLTLAKTNAVIVYNDPQFLEGRQPKKLAAASYSVFCSLSVSLVSLLRIPLAENHCRHNSKRVF
jgi:hypothetical protein